MWGTSRQQDEILSAFRMKWEKAEVDWGRKDTSFLHKNQPGKPAARIISTLRKRHSLRLDLKDQETFINALLSSAVWQCWHLSELPKHQRTPTPLAFFFFCPQEMDVKETESRSRLRQFLMTTQAKAHQ